MHYLGNSSMFVETILELPERGKCVKAPNDSTDLWMEFMLKNLQEKSRRALPGDSKQVLTQQYLQ